VRAVAEPPKAPPRKLSTWESIRRSFTSWRLASVTLLSFPSGMPLGLVITSVPFWMQQEGINIKTIGWLQLAGLPYSFKFVWSPLMDRYAPRNARRRGWIAVFQVALALVCAAFAVEAGGPRIAMVALLTFGLSFASASQDIAIDAYAVEVLEPDERGAAVGARASVYRAAMYLAGATLITVSAHVGWRASFVAISVLFLATLALTFLSPEPAAPARPPVSLRSAVWEPFVGFFRHSNALQIAAFLFFYKLADNLAQALIRPFLGQMGFSPDDIGLGTAVVGVFATLAGTFIGGVVTTGMGLGRALWLFGFIQIIANAGYALLAQVGLNRPLMYAAMGVEAAASGMGAGAMGVLLLAITQKRFSATQFALFSSIFALGRTLSGPPAGVLADALGWRNFFLFTMPVGIPGLLLLHGFSPWGKWDIAPPSAEGEGGAVGEPRTLGAVAWRGVAGALLGTGAGYLVNATLAALKAVRAEKIPFNLAGGFDRLFHPPRPIDWVDVASPPLMGLLLGFSVAAYLTARHGIRRT
jgi:PAT family beta-lactamase induction signal transducer AmpG